MESFRLNSRIIEEEKEFLIQTVNEASKGFIRSSVFIDGELLDSAILPHSEEITEDQVLNLVKMTHTERKMELEHLLKSYHDILQGGTPEMMYQLGTALFHKRLYPEAQRLFRSAIKLKSGYHEALFFLSQVELALNNPMSAIQYGVKALEIKPDYADYRNNLGEAYLAAEYCRKATVEFEEAINKNIYYADAYFNLARTYILNAINKEDFNLTADLRGKTEEMLKKAALIYPFYKNSTFDDALSALHKGELKQAYKYLGNIQVDKKEKQRQEKATYFHKYLMSTEWLTRNNIKERMSFLDKEIKKNPDYVDLYFELAICHLYQAKFGWQEGIDYMKKAVELNPSLKKAVRALDLAEDFYLKMTDSIHDISEKKSDWS